MLHIFLSTYTSPHKNTCVSNGETYVTPSKGIYKANKTHSSLLAEKRYSNNRLPGRLPNPGLIHKRVKSKHSTRPSAVARFHHNLGKVVTSPHSVIDFSGPLYRFEVNVIQSPREKKIMNIQSKCQSLIRNPTSSACEIASLIGSLEAARPTFWPVPLHYRELQIQLIKSLEASRDNYKTLVSQSSNAHTELQWWFQNITTVNGSTINLPAPELYITSDASKAGWGACCQNLTANGRWSPMEARDHIGVLKLKAAFLATKAFLKDRSNITVCLCMDNTSAVAHINNKGGNLFPSASKPNSRTMQVVSPKINSDHCSAPTRQTQQRGRQRVERVFRLHRMGNRPTSDSALPKKVQCRSLCVTPSGSPPNLCQLDTRSGCYRIWCNDF